MTFDQSLYQALDKTAAKYFREDPEINWIPRATVDILDAPEYKKPIFGNSIGVTGETRLGASKQRMETPKSHYVYPLNYVQGDIYYDQNDMMTEGVYLVQRKAQEIATWEDQVKQAIFKGVRTGIPSATGINTMYDANGAGQGAVLNTGIIEQATLVENLNGGDSKLDAAGDVYLAMAKMYRSIPARFRDGRKVVFGWDDLFDQYARKALFRGSTNQQSELDLFLNEHADKIERRIVSDKLFLNLVAGATKTEADTIGTHSRIFCGVIDPNIVEQAYSRVGRMPGEDRVNVAGSVTQRWAARCSGCVHQPLGIVYSEQITWA